MIGKPSVEPGAVKLNQLHCNVLRAVVTGDGRWTEHTKSEMERKDSALIESSSTLLLIDYECHSVFRILHNIFLAYGVYVVVFNMVHMLGNNERELDDSNIDKSLNEISFWINSIQTLITETRKTVPVFLVGTHKDVVSNISDHVLISDKIRERYEFSGMWPSFQANDSICFFPVNNRVGHGDGVIKKLMALLEQNIAGSAPRKRLSWRKSWDSLVDKKKAVLGLTEAASLVKVNGIKDNNIPSLLSFLHEMGDVLWIDDFRLRDILILDIINVFAEPATLVLYDYISRPSESNNSQHKNIQQYCKKNDRRAWDQMTMKGIVDLSLVKSLLGEALSLDIMPKHRVQCNINIIPVLVEMMLKYGLLVRLERATDRVVSPCTNAFPDQYLIPSLLPPINGDPNLFVDDNWNYRSLFYSCYFVFSARRDSRISFSFSWLKNCCYIPRGLFYRIIADCSKLCELSTEIIHFYQNYAFLLFEHRRIRLVCFPVINCVR